jgi:HTH-type transcriptional regulator/antitoxin HigA
MEEHGLGLSDLPEIGTSEKIEAILNKEQALTLNQIQQLAQRFKVQPQVFLDWNLSCYPSATGRQGFTTSLG